MKMRMRDKVKQAFQLDLYSITDSDGVYLSGIVGLIVAIYVSLLFYIVTLKF